MLRPLLAGGLMLALASTGASQSIWPQRDDALSPMEIIANLPKQPPASQARHPKAAVKPDAAKKPDDNALSPAEIIANLAKEPAASQAKQPKAAAKPDAAKQPDDDALSPAEIIANLAKEPPASQAKQPKATAKPAAGKAAPVKRDADGLEQCLNDWDRGTHMTRAEWARTCRRVVANRARLLREQQGK